MTNHQPPSIKLPAIDRLLQVMAALRDPNGGCPWDVQQNFTTIAPYTIEEAYEVADAIARGNMTDLRDELGDLLLQVVFHSQMAKEAGHFSFSGVATAITDKMIRRHPHVFDDGLERDTESQTRAWEDQKAFEREDKSQKRKDKANPRVLADVALALPALMRAEKLQKRAARVGFDWPDAAPVFEKIDEEISELQSALAASTPSKENIHEELGDLLFSVVNLARKLNIDPESALRDANEKFTDRFQYIEKTATSSGKSVKDMQLSELEDLWQAAKTEQITKSA